MIFFAASSVAITVAVASAITVFCKPKNRSPATDPQNAAKLGNAAPTPGDAPTMESNYTMPSFSGTLMIGSKPEGTPESPPVMSMAVRPDDKRVAVGNGLVVDKEGKAISAYAGREKK
uniref:Lipoprotein n=1 Tax=Steinernema glaseri TaxID=37863 RepID=A0A1I7ZRL6_9BILA